MIGWAGFFMAAQAFGRIHFIVAEIGHICPGGCHMTGRTLFIKMPRRLFLTMAGNTVCRSGQDMVRFCTFESALVVTKSALHLKMVFRPAVEMAAQTIGSANQLMVEVHFIPQDRAVAVDAVAFIMLGGTDDAMALLAVSRHCRIIAVFMADIATNHGMLAHQWKWVCVHVRVKY